jgi:hypothetical protein
LHPRNGLALFDREDRRATTPDKVRNVPPKPVHGRWHPLKVGKVDGRHKIDISGNGESERAQPLTHQNWAIGVATGQTYEVILASCYRQDTNVVVHAAPVYPEVNKAGLAADVSSSRRGSGSVIVDGNTATMWSSSWANGTPDDHPHWLPMLRRIQAAGKGLFLYTCPEELDALMDGLRPEGVILNLWAASPAEADALVAKVAAWRRVPRLGP